MAVASLYPLCSCLLRRLLLYSTVLYIYYIILYCTLLLYCCCLSVHCVWTSRLLSGHFRHAGKVADPRSQTMGTVAPTTVVRTVELYAPWILSHVGFSPSLRSSNLINVCPQTQTSLESSYDRLQTAHREI